MTAPDAWFDPVPGVIKVSPQHEWILRAWKWRIKERHGAAYVARKTSERVDGQPKGRTVYLHRQIMQLQMRDPREIDHLDGDTMNNQIENLEIVTRRQNNERRHAREQREAARAAAERNRAMHRRVRAAGGGHN